MPSGSTFAVPMAAKGIRFRRNARSEAILTWVFKPIVDEAPMPCRRFVNQGYLDFISPVSAHRPPTTKMIVPKYTGPIWVNQLCAKVPV